MKCYSFLHWYKHLDSITMDNIRFWGLPVHHFTNSFFDFCWSYFSITLLVALHLFCCLLNPTCTFILFYIFLLYSRPEFSSFFLVWYDILFIWLSIQFPTGLWMVRLEQSVLPILLNAVLISFYSGSFCFNPLLKLFSNFFIPFLFYLIQIIQACILTFLSQHFFFSCFNETNIFAKCNYFWLNTFLQNGSSFLFFISFILNIWVISNTHTWRACCPL